MADGRPSKLTKKMREKFVKQIRRGAYYEVAAANCGISERTLYYWLKRGKEAETRNKYFKFLQAVKEAESDLEVELGERLYKEGGHKGIVNFMERRWKNRWSKIEKKEVEHSGEVKQKTESKVKVEHDIPDHLIPVIADLAARIDTEKTKPGKPGTGG